MRAEEVSYLFSQAELAALMEITDGWLPLCSFDKAELVSGIGSLEQGQLLVKGGEDYAVDRIIAFLIECTKYPASAVCVQEKGAYLGLFDGPAALLVQQHRGRWKLTPYQNIREAADAFLSQTACLEGGAEVFQRSESGQWSGTVEEREHLLSLLRRAADRMIRHMPPQEEEESAWKP